MTLFRRDPVPEVLRSALDPEERLLGMLRTEEDEVLAASRFGLWRVRDGQAERWPWHLISKARLTGGLLAVTVADPVAEWPDGTVLTRDRPEVLLRPRRLTRLTDTVHHRVRGSVAASRHLDWPGAGGWVVLRRVAGRNGLTVQVRLDQGADWDARGFPAAVAAVVDQVWPPEVPRSVGLSGSPAPGDGHGTVGE